MASFLTFHKYFSNFPSLSGLPLETYSIRLSLDRLVPGVNNIHYDVHLSPVFLEATRKTVFTLIARHCQAEKILGIDKKSNWVKERDEFKRLCRDVLVDVVNKAKSNREIQIDFLGQVAVVKILIEEIRHQYEKLIECLIRIIRKYEISLDQNLEATIKLKERLSDIQKKRETILRNASNEMFQCLIDVQQKDLKDMREANFGGEFILPDDIFSNPILHIKHLSDDFFMMEEYVLLGHRYEDPDQYDNLIFVVKDLLSKIAMKDWATRKHSGQSITNTNQDDETSAKKSQDTDYNKIDGWIKQVDNIDILFNCFQSEKRYKTLKKQKVDEKDLLNIKKFAKNQKRLLNFFYKKFKKTGLIKRIVAAYEMEPFYLEYCPPLVPQQVLQFLIEPKKRKIIVNQLKRLKGFYGKPFSLTPLRKKIKDLDRIKTRKKKAYLIRFLKGFARYHRDLQNFNMLKEAMDNVNLTSNEKIINLSRANQTLYEFLLPHESVKIERPIINHVIVKADVRGSTDITNMMREKKLNPASYFSLNLFDPINQILSEYGAVKMFIEGDAIILSIFEHEDTPEGWYSVALACGLAMNMLLIIQRYNAISKKFKLPVLELGIGISYHNKPPTFLFDGDNRIMISPAINLADRLSGCTKSLRSQIAKYKSPFNLYVYQTASEKEISATADDLFLRYNVNGIELNAEGFKKLSEEIDLKFLECSIPDLQKEKIRIYTGKFPTITGKYQQLVIREAPIPAIEPEIVSGDLNVIRLTDRNYYEVCTNPKLHEYLRKMG